MAFQQGLMEFLEELDHIINGLNEEIMENNDF
jgi:hypothetical protein